MRSRSKRATPRRDQRTLGPRSRPSPWWSSSEMTYDLPPSMRLPPRSVTSSAGIVSK